MEDLILEPLAMLSSPIPGLSMLIAPLIAGLFMSMVVDALRGPGKEPTQLESFGYGFAFAVGIPTHPSLLLPLISSGLDENLSFVVK